MAKANGYMNDNNLYFVNSKVDLNDFYQQQDQGTLGYVSTPHSVVQDMDSLIYTQQHGPKDKSSTTTAGLAYLDQKEQCVYTTTNSDRMGSCTISAQNTLPMMAGSSSSSTMGTDSTTTTTAAASMSSPSPSTWTPSASPLSTSFASSNCMSAPLLFPVSSSTDPSFLSTLSPSLSIAPKVDTTNFISNNNNIQQQPLDAYHSKSLDYPSPMPTFYHQQQQQQQQPSVSINALSPTFMPSYYYSNLTSATPPRTTNLPTMTTSASAPTAMTATNDMQISPCSPQQSVNLSSQAIHENETDQDMLPTDHSQLQSNTSTTTNTELRRQIHIQSEQKRRAQIKDGFEDLRNELPSCLNKKMSKVALLQRTVQHIQHLKSTQITILGELERLINENEHLKKFQENVIQHP